MRLRSLAWLALMAMTACAPADCSFSAPAGETLLGGCRQGECGWLRVRSMEALGSYPQGELKRMLIRRGRSLHPDGTVPDREGEGRIEWEGSERFDYVFCSLQRPAYAFSDDEGRGLIVHFLDLYDLGGYQMGSARLYMRFCHGRDGLPEADGLQRLGYRPGTRSDQVENATPETLTRF